MKLWEALKIHEETGRKIRPIAPSGDYAFLPMHEWFKGNSREAANNFMMWEWEVEPAKVEVTREQVEAALIYANYNQIQAMDGFVNLVCKELGL